MIFLSRTIYTPPSVLCPCQLPTKSWLGSAFIRIVKKRKIKNEGPFQPPPAFTTYLRYFFLQHLVLFYSIFLPGKLTFPIKYKFPKARGLCLIIPQRINAYAKYTLPDWGGEGDILVVPTDYCLNHSTSSRPGNSESPVRGSTRREFCDLDVAGDRPLPAPTLGHEPRASQRGTTGSRTQANSPTRCPLLHVSVTQNLQDPGR